MLMVKFAGELPAMPIFLTWGVLGGIHPSQRDRAVESFMGNLRCQNSLPFSSHFPGAKVRLDHLLLGKL